MPNAEGPGSSQAWRLRGHTLQAMLLLCMAQLAVKLVPFRYWRGSLGLLGAREVPAQRNAPAGAAQRIAVHIERGAARLPFATKCLPRAVALCWLLRRAQIAYTLKIAARPAAVRQAQPSADGDLHAWVEAENATVIGALAGPWLVVLALSG